MGTDTTLSQAALLAALDEVVQVADANIERFRQIKRRAMRLRKQLTSGRSLFEALQTQPRPLIVELITENITALNRAGARLRWIEAATLREAGLSVADIARLFDVSRQRISELLLHPPAAAAVAERPGKVGSGAAEGPRGIGDKRAGVGGGT